MFVIDKPMTISGKSCFGRISVLNEGITVASLDARMAQSMRKNSVKRKRSLFLAKRATKY